MKIIFKIGIAALCLAMVMMLASCPDTVPEPDIIFPPMSEARLSSLTFEDVPAVLGDGGEAANVEEDNWGLISITMPQAAAGASIDVVTLDVDAVVSGYAIAPPGVDDPQFVSVFTSPFTTNARINQGDHLFIRVFALDTTMHYYRLVAEVTDIRTVLTGGSGVNVSYSDTSAEVEFTGALGLDLSVADFAISDVMYLQNPRSSIAGVSVDGDIATVTINFTDNKQPAERLITVSMEPESDYIRGSSTVDIAQAALPNELVGFFEQFGAGTTAATLPWTFITGIPGGDNPATQAMTYAINSAGDIRFSGTGSGGRGGGLDFKDIVPGERVYVEFDFMPMSTSFTGRGPSAYFSVNAQPHNITTFAADKIITFYVVRTNNTSHQLWYRLGNHNAANGDYSPATPVATRIQNGLPANLNVWVRIKLDINFAADTISFTVTNTAGTTTYANVQNAALNEAVRDANQVASFRFENGRVDGTWTARLDNVYVGLVPR